MIGWRAPLIALSLLAVTASIAAGVTDEPIQRVTLANGARLFLQQRPGCGTFAVELCALGGRAEDPSDQLGLTEVLSQMLLRGTQSRTGEDQATDVERVGATLDAIGGILGVSLRASGPAGALSPTLDVVLDAARRPQLDSGDLAKEAGLERQRLSRSLDLPSTERERVMLPLLFGDHPLGRVAQPQGYLTTLDVETVRRTWAARRVGARLIVVVVGDFDAAVIRDQVAASLGDLPPGASPSPLPRPRPLQDERRARARHRTAQPELLVALPTGGVGEADEPAMDLLAQILGGFEERLSYEIREKRGWAYWLGALDRRYPGAGAFGIVTAVPRSRLKETVRIIEQEMSRIAAAPPSQDEVDRARRYLVTSLARTWQQSAGRAAVLAGAAIRGRPPRTFDELAAGYAAVTPEAIGILAHQLIGSSALAVVTLY